MVKPLLELPSPRRCLRLLCSRAAARLVDWFHGAVVLLEPTAEVVSRRLVFERTLEDPAPPIFQGARREREAVVVAEFDRDVLLPRDVVGAREFRRDEMLLRRLNEDEELSRPAPRRV